MKFSNEIEEQFIGNEKLNKISNTDYINMKKIEEEILKQQEQLEKLLCKEKSMGEMFKEYYTFSMDKEPKGQLMDLFLEIVNEGSDILDETN